MSEGLRRALILVGALGSGVVAGVFYAFSAFVMRALDRLVPAEGIRAMQSMNREAPTFWLMAALLGTAALCVVLAVDSLRRLDAPGAGWILAGALTYLVTVVVTATYHVPRNNALDAVNPSAADAAGLWSHYVTTWTAGNHVRVAAPLAAAALLTIGFRAS
jgi:uncharacterized membrane protein